VDVKKLVPILLAVVLSSAPACTPHQTHPVDLPPPVTATRIGVGDVFELRIVGEDKLPFTYTVAPDGTVDLPYIKRVKVDGLEPQELAATVRAKLVEQQILTDPSVSISVKEYNSQRVEVLGEVQKPGSIALVPGMKLLRAIAMAGGFNAMANKNRVILRRRVQGGTKVVTVSVEDIIDNRIPDPQLQAGDSINIEQRIF
jgi:protein involved in polysaccharide export with SLBB domain